MEDQQNPLAVRLESAASALTTSPAAIVADTSLLRYLGYDDGATAQAEGRARLLRAAARFRRLFLLPVPDAPGLTFFGAEADPATFGKPYEGLPMGNLAGSGLTPQRAFEACVGEGIEYLSQFVRADNSAELGPPAVYANAPDEHARRLINEILAACSIDTDRPISWVAAGRLSDGAKVRFPLDLCCRRRASEQDFAPPLKLSSGCAAGATVEAATLRALLELVERDAAALWWRGGHRGRAIAPDSEAAAAATKLLTQLRQGKTDRRTWLLDITTDVQIPAVVALSAREDGFGFAFGLGARLTLAEAAQAAIFELCQVELGQHVVDAKRKESGDAALSENDRRQLRRGTLFDTRYCKLLQPEPAHFPAEGHDAPLSGLQGALERLGALGIAVYAVDLTRPELGIPVIRTIAPGLQLEPCQIVGPRLSRVINETGGGAVHHGGMPLL
ncbi:MAG TPA: YcaO-like family protein [Bradyrhizobium sp.]|uniref:YcaO-like family protein n=1 Tax=Bradyrhizobium sp. TaxID=376 RepID=UPI002B7F626C|nr:YcaO-like family protein [Bradyrhizobium sp.]HLZ00918.1 YcaO-like family protein [Bradyrhizobium sp.]